MGFRVNRSVTARGWGKYLIMHKNRHVATIREDGSCTVYFPSFMPYSLYLESGNDLDTRLNNLNNFYFWCASRSRLLTNEDIGIVPMEYVELYCVNHDVDRDAFVKKKDAYAYYMMNIIDYLVGNTDRHWGNWGFLVDHATNRLTQLHPLMDFNKAFQAYDTLEGALCQTVSRAVSQKNAALEGVRKIGLNQIEEVKKDWFWDEGIWNMFCRRLETLRSADW